MSPEPIMDWDELLEFWNDHRDKGNIGEPTHVGFEQNPKCGNVVKLYLIVTDGVIREIKYEGSGTVLCIATTAVLCYYAKGMTVEEALKFNPLELYQFDITPARMECARLPVRAMREALNGQTEN